MAAKVIPTGSISLDAALGIGGFPRGRIVEIFGAASSGKTTLALHAIAEAQKLGGTAAFIDAEHALDPVYAGRIGVDIGKLLVSQPECGDQALDIAAALAASRVVDMIVVDSVAALVPREEVAAPIGGGFFEFHDRLMSRALRRMGATAARTDTCLIFVNQLRRRQDTGYGNPETTTGGNALKLHAAIRVEIRKIAPVTQGGTPGARTRVTVLKNSLAASARTAEFDVLYGEGISREGDALDFAIRNSVVKKAGTAYSYRNSPLGSSREIARLHLKREAHVCEAVIKDLRRALGLPVALPVDA
jgi:recombination protein RecA